MNIMYSFILFCFCFSSKFFDIFMVTYLLVTLGFLLAGGEYVDENEIYKLSLALEPKSSGDDKDSMAGKFIRKTLSFKVTHNPKYKTK